MKRSSGSYSKNSRNLRGGRKPAITKFLATYPAGSRVRLAASTRTKSGRHHLRYEKLVGEVVGRQGSAWKVKVKVGGKEKVLVVTSPHLSRMV